MGFYSASTIVEDAKRHDVEIRPVDVVHSDWDCTLDKTRESRCAIRMGLRYVKSLGERHWERIERARTDRPFSSIEDFVARTELDAGTITRLAESGSFSILEPNRRSAIWIARGHARTPPVDLPMPIPERTPRFRQLSIFDTIGWDYRFTGHSTSGHPLAPLREALAKRRLPDAKTVGDLPDGRRVRYAGMVICRQRPGTASGVVFMTLEDETGFVNVVVWSKIFEQFAVLIKTSAFLGVTGKLQVQDGVTHVIADAFWTPPITVRPESGGSRDFH
jgi:error-prone DNA polymerase